ncbi:serine hydrolase domain-containing protein [Galbitalea soli]|uniref:serine hydrolase domain-containing protein n=1 Tax=Galbitalea soli TaxID=1268042 RepID=UPI00181FCB7B|nr:CubicO group peptidase (beta-lactamase class C family) [Galbitalea soli]
MNSPTPLPRSTPDSQGVSARGLAEFVTALDAAVAHPHSVMVMRHGTVIAEGWWAPYAATLPHMMFSVSKSFTAMAVGLAIVEGRLSVDDRVIELLRDDAPAAPSPHLAAMRVRDLLTMTAGHATESLPPVWRLGDRSWAAAILDHPVEHEPGTRFVYNSGASYLLAAIVQRVTGERMLDYLTPRLLEPLGIAGAQWQQSPQGIDTGGWGLSITTEDLARFGQFLLQRGEWNGRQLVPREWIETATSAVVSNAPAGGATESDWSMGYGYQFWQCRHGAYRADGAFGQFCVVLPEQDAVLVLTGGYEDMQAALAVAWSTLLPAFEGADPDATRTAAELTALLSTLSIPAPPPAEPATLRVEVEPNEWEVRHVTIDADHIRFDGRFGTRTMAFGEGVWMPGSTTLHGAVRDIPELASVRIQSAAAWLSPTHWRGQMILVETPFLQTLDIVVDGDSASLTLTQNVSFRGPDIAQLAGRVER